MGEISEEAAAVIANRRGRLPAVRDELERWRGADAAWVPCGGPSPSAATTMPLRSSSVASSGSFRRRLVAVRRPRPPPPPEKTHRLSCLQCCRIRARKPTRRNADAPEWHRCVPIRTPTDSRDGRGRAIPPKRWAQQDGRHLRARPETGDPTIVFESQLDVAQEHRPNEEHWCRSGGILWTMASLQCRHLFPLPRSFSHAHATIGSSLD
jgi:hypothetical protein